MRRLLEELVCSVEYVEKPSTETLIEQAIRPTGIEIIVDPPTQDRILVYRVGEKPPVVIRMTYREILRARRELLRLEARFLN